MASALSNGVHQYRYLAQVKKKLGLTIDIKNEAVPSSYQTLPPNKDVYIGEKARSTRNRDTTNPKNVVSKEVAPDSAVSKSTTSKTAVSKAKALKNVVTKTTTQSAKPETISQTSEAQAKYDLSEPFPGNY
jgi:hypothetical protein